MNRWMFGCCWSAASAAACVSSFSEDRLSVHDFDFAYLLRFGVVQSLLEAGLPGDAEPGRMSLHQPHRLDLLVALGLKELGDGHDELQRTLLHRPPCRRRLAGNRLIGEVATLVVATFAA